MSTDTILSEGDFLKWASERLGELKSLTVVSHTPIFIQYEEHAGKAEPYLRALRTLWDSGKIPLTYYMPKREILSRVSRLQTFAEEIRSVASAFRITNPNVRAVVVPDTEFPLNSFWVAEDQDGSPYTFMKIPYQESQGSAAHPPIWLGFRLKLPIISDLIRLMDRSGVPLNTFLDGVKEDLVEGSKVE